MSEISLYWLAIGTIAFMWIGIILFPRYDRYKQSQAQHELIAKLLNENLDLRKASPMALAGNLNAAANNRAGVLERSSPEFSLNRESLARITRFYRSATHFSRVKENVKYISDLLFVILLTILIYPIISPPNSATHSNVNIEYLPWIAIPVGIFIVMIIASPVLIGPISIMLRAPLKDYFRTRLRRKGYSYGELVQIRTWLDLQQAQAEDKRSWEILTKLVDERLAELKGETAPALRSPFTKTEATPA
jgi:hypothetical protein